MGSRDKRARDADRNLAIEFVQNAWVDGQLTRDEHEERVERVLRAGTVADVEREVCDLQGPGGQIWRPTVPPVAPRVHDEPPGAGAATRTSQAEADAALVSRARVCIVVGAVVIGALLALGNGMNHDEQAATAFDFAPSFDLEAFAEVVEAEFGTTRVHSATFGEGMWVGDNVVTVVVPQGDPGLAYEAQWDGDLEEWSERTERQAEGGLVDLADLAPLDLASIESDAAQEPELVEGIAVEVRADTYERRPVCVSATAGGDGSDVVLRYDCDGDRL